MSELGLLTISEGEAAIERKQRGQSLEEQAEEWSGSLKLFVKYAWSDGLEMAAKFTPGWHIDAICEHLEAVSAGELLRLAICVPPGSTKSTIASICYPAWEWTRNPKRRHITASYEQRLATRFSVTSRTLMGHHWYTSRWGNKFKLKGDENLKTEYANNRGGRRLAMSTDTGTGEHADVIIIDDPHNAKKILSDADREGCIEWHDSIITTRFTESKTGAEVIIAQRLHERDLIGHVLRQEPEAWTVLCLPERYEPKHPLVTPARVRLASGREISGDCREVEGELLCPGRIDEEENLKRQKRLTQFRAAGQLQQRPAAREGAILKRADWQFFPAEWLEDGERHRLPRFHGLVQSWDTAFKDSTVSDFVAGGLWGLTGPNCYLLALRHGRMSLSQTKQAIKDMTAWCDREYPRLPLHVLVENKSNGPRIIAELRSELRGILPVNSGDTKTERAMAAEPALEGHNIFVPGRADPSQPSYYDGKFTPDMTQGLIEECASFPFGEHDDRVDQFTQMVIWSRGAGGRQPASFGRPSSEGRPIDGGSISGVE